MTTTSTRTQSRQAAGGGGMESGELAKASLAIFEDGKRGTSVEFMYNPTEYSLSKTNEWKAVSIVGFDVPSSQFLGGGPTTLSLDLLADTYEQKRDVRTIFVNKIIEMTKIYSKTVDKTTKTGRPPKVLFSWGKVFNFPAVITELKIQYILFLSDGTPVRARISLTLQECEDTKPPPQNPTTQGILGQKAYIVQPADTIDRIAYREYSDSRAWRFIADTNNLDDPRDLKTGQVLAIQPFEA